LSGDHQAVTDSVALELSRAAAAPGLFSEVIGGATPETKLAYVRSEMVNGPVVVVGDGVNDAAALAAASVGIAVKGGAEASLLAADVYLGDSGLGQLVDVVEGARRTLATVRRGIVMSLSYNVVMIGLAMAGLIGPLLAAVLMPVSSLSVVTNAYRSKTFRRTR
jgi:Cu2+-exporting ATPase